MTETEIESPAPPVPVIKPITEMFRGDCAALWATTYNLDLALFNEYLLGRLGDPPLNVVILADRNRLDAALEAVPEERLDVLGPVNRRWLLRGARIGNGRFHPKSYLSVTAHTARLLVGSGNLSTNGIDAGREVFTAFQSGTAVGDAAIRTWRSWARRLVENVGDTLLAGRFADLEGRLPSPTGPTPVVESPVLHNLDEPLIDQLCKRATSTAGAVDELIVTAPFLDEAGEAVGQLIDRLSPRRCTLYVATSTNVDGPLLASRLAGTGADIQVLAYRPDRFTHAKLIGIVSGDSGWLMSGSANLSHAALTLAAGAGNVELAVIAGLDADVIRQRFLPPDVEAEAVSLETLADLTYETTPEEGNATAVRLVQAELLSDGRIRITTSPPPLEAWRLADHQTAQPIVLTPPTATTTAALAGSLVHLVDSEGRSLSNRLIVDDVEALHRSLQAGERSGTGRPTELIAADLDTPLGQALVFLHRNVVMDVSERSGTGGSTEANADEAAGGNTDDDLWARLEREKLGRDPRASTYDRLLGAHALRGTGIAEPLIELLEAMRDRTPSEDGSAKPGSVLKLLTERQGDGTRWSSTAKVRVRARNVLRRWAAAQTDPRLSWVNPLAPLGNLTLVALIFGRLWWANSQQDAAVELPPEDLDSLWAGWFHPFVGSGQNDGWLDRADVDAETIQTALTDDFIRNVTALCWLALRPGAGRRERVVTWQPYLQAAFDRGLIDVDEDTIAFLRACGHDVDVNQVTDHLLRALDFIDDPLWCERTASALSLPALSLEAVSEAQQASVRLRVKGIADPLHDPKVPRLIVAVCRYRSTEEVALYAADADWRLVVSGTDPAMFLHDLSAPDVEATTSGLEPIEDAAKSQGVLADVFPREEQVA